MLKNIFVENFMRIDARVDLDLGPVTVLVGANGSGKSFIVESNSLEREVCHSPRCKLQDDLRTDGLCP